MSTNERMRRKNFGKKNKFRRIYIKLNNTERDSEAYQSFNLSG